MYSQKNVLQVFVSKYAAITAAGETLASLKDGAIGLFSAATNLSVAATTVAAGGYVAFNDKGIFKKSPVFKQVVAAADLEAHVAAVAHTETVTIPAPVVGEYYQVTINILSKNGMGDNLVKGVATAATGDTATTIATRIVAHLNKQLSRENNKNFTVSNAAGVITIVAGAAVYSPRRRPGGFSEFKSFLTFPENIAVAGTVTVPGVPGIGMGYSIHSKELFAMGNSDAVRDNDYRTAFPGVLNASPIGAYKVLNIVATPKQGTANADVNTPVTIVAAFDNAGGAIP